ncbi:glycosyltransferase [Mycoplasma elephantis]|uniref:glycosyltransferase n=1 Tax=Mycoplasma elephantis TaxID=114882 RepID=UPI000488FD6F|nr:glycosyltransferase [Mycoplasma elephantis]
MKLSIISVINSKFSDIGNFLNSIASQDNQDFELILVIQKVNDNILKQLDKLPNQLNGKTKIITNYKDLNVEYLMFCGLKIAEGDYFTFIFPNSIFRSYTTNVFIEDILKYNTDIIEYKPRLIGDVRWKPKARITDKKIYDINKPKFIALSFPFIFNKLYKKELVSKIININENFSGNSKFSIELLYYLLFNATSYCYNDYRVVRESVDKDFVITPRTFKNTWINLSNYLQHKDLKYKHELMYANFYYSCILTPGLLTVTTFLNRIGLNVTSNRFSKLNLEKMDKHIEKLFENEFNNFAFKNKYMNLGLPENEFMSKKVPMSNWKSILKKLNG